MKISLEDCGKKYEQLKLFRHLSNAFVSPEKWAIIGPNGSGKSTLLRILAGMQMPTEGRLTYQLKDTLIAPENAFRYLSYCAPGLELIEEMTLVESLQFHFQFKKVLPGISLSELISIMGLVNSASKPLSKFSSGMMQRVKLGIAIFSNTPVVLLDEPCSNLDDAGIAQYHSWIKDYCPDRLVIVASNDAKEYSYCDKFMKISDY